jgi:Bifunctional DNA primase/polymerase, N-terminal
MPETPLSTALMFAEYGFPAGPCCRPTPTGCSYSKHAKDTPCKYPGKSPIPYRGVQGYTTDPVKIAQFFRWYPSANVGVAMGRVSGHFVIESDGPQGEAFLHSFHLPPTPTVVSARGLHHYLKIPTGYVVKTTHIGQLDIIGDRDQVIGPGSLHVSGHIYHWHDYLSLEDVDPIEPPEPLRVWLLQRGILRVSATRLTRPTPSNRRKAAVRGRARNDARRNDGQASGGVTAGGGSKTRASLTTPRLVTPLAPDEKHAHARSTDDAPEPWLAELAKKPALFDRVFRFVGLGAVALGDAHLCTLHHERHPSAVLTIGDNGFPVYLDLHAEDTDLLAYTMPDYYRARLLGRGLRRGEKLTGPSLMPWWERLLVEMGELAPVPVPHRPLPDTALASVRQVYERFLYLCACKWIYQPNAPTTFSVRFGREWCGIGSDTTFLHARNLLVQHRYIEELPPMYSKDGQRLVLYRPGPGE